VNARRLLYLGMVWSCYWAVLFFCGYRRSESDRVVGGPSWAEEFVWTVYLSDPGEKDTHRVELPHEFRAQSRRADRVAQLHHTVSFLGWDFFATEAFLIRDERGIDVWRQYALPFPLIAALWVLAPFGLAALVVGSAVYVRGMTLLQHDGPLWKELDIRLVAYGVTLAASLAVWTTLFHGENDAFAVSRAAQNFKGAAWCDGHPDGAWTGDVAELYRLGGIRRAIAEADAEPIRPLVPEPRPYHGYLFFAMDTGPEGTDLKKRTRNRDFAYCAFPADEGPNQQVWLVCSGGFFGRKMEGGLPIRTWPTDNDLKGWGRYCGIPEPFCDLAYGAKMPWLALK